MSSALFYLLPQHFALLSSTTTLCSSIFYHNTLDQSICNSRVSGHFLLLLCFIEIPETNANSVDPGQMPHSDLDLHCLPPFGVLQLKWVKDNFNIIDCLFFQSTLCMLGKNFSRRHFGKFSYFSKHNLQLLTNPVFWEK